MAGIEKIVYIGSIYWPGDISAASNYVILEPKLYLSALCRLSSCLSNFTFKGPHNGSPAQWFRHSVEDLLCLDLWLTICLEVKQADWKNISPCVLKKKKKSN